MKQIFESERIRFVEVSKELVRDYLVMVNDYERVNRWLGGRRDAYTEAQELEWVEEKLAEKAVVFSMIEKSSGSFIGNIELMDVSDSVGELGIAVTGQMQNQGYGTEAVSALIRYALGTLGLNRVFLRTYPGNARAIHVYEKCGFRPYDRTESDLFMSFTGPLPG